MRRLLIGLLLPLLTGGCVTPQGQALHDGKTEQRVLVTIHQAPARAVRQRNRGYGNERGYLTAREERELDRLARRYGLKRVSGWPIEPLGVYCEVFEVPATQSPAAVVAALAADPSVESAQLMHEFETLAEPETEPSLLDIQHSLHDMDVPRAHRWTSGRDIRVAVVDSWVDRSHPELRRRVSTSVRFTPDGSDGDPEDVHGTAVAGIIAAEDDQAGITGVAPGAELLALQACWRSTGGSGSARCDSFSLAQALTLGIRKDAQVINLSLGGPHDPLLERLIQHALDSGTFVVTAHSERWGFPASVPGVLAVGEPRPDSDAGIAAPARDVITTIPDDRYDFLSGSSLAAAHASGVIALLLELAPAARPEVIARALAGASAEGALNACMAVAIMTEGRACATPATQLRTPQQGLVTNVTVSPQGPHNSN
ncbi:MAG: S8 family serine peptidase [Pseudomonadota bacterium]